MGIKSWYAFKVVSILVYKVILKRKDYMFDFEAIISIGTINIGSTHFTLWSKMFSALKNALIQQKNLF